jgi:hypothetical protein
MALSSSGHLPSMTRLYLSLSNAALKTRAVIINLISRREGGIRGGGWGIGEGGFEGVIRCFRLN